MLGSYEFATIKRCAIEHLTTCKILGTVKINEWTAIIPFFHDLEPEILCELLVSPAHYVGAQGSWRTGTNRAELLKGMDAHISILPKMVVLGGQP